MREVRLAIVGFGNMGSAHAACVHSGKIQGLRMAAVCDVSAARRDLCREKYPEIPVYSDYREMFAAGLANAALVAVPHRLHAEIGIQAIQAGLHLLSEKPLDARLSQAKKLVSAAEASDRVFAIMFNQRTNPLFRRAREIVRSGELGALKRSVWIITNWYRSQRYYDSGSWRATWAGEGGGVLLNQAPHNLDLWQWICGMPKSVVGFCDVAKYHEIEVEDDATIYARYANGAVGTFITTTGEYPGTNRLEIAGERGKLVLEEGVLKWWKLREGERDVRFASESNSPAIPMDYQEIRPDAPETAHAGILQNFTNAILNGETLISPGADGLNQLELTNAAYLSEWLGNREIELPLDEDRFNCELDARALRSKYHAAENESSAESAYSPRWQVNW